MDKETFALKILDCEETLYRISMSMLKNEKDCEDAVQDTILTAFSKLNTLKNEQYFKTWLVRILINKCNKQLHYKKRNMPATNIEVVNNREQSTEIKLALEKLPPKIKIVIVMFYIEDFSINEIKSVLKIPEGTVKSRLSKGRKLLKLELDIK